MDMKDILRRTSPEGILTPIDGNDHQGNYKAASFSIQRHECCHLVISVFTYGQPCPELCRETLSGLLISIRDPRRGNPGRIC